MSRQHYVGRSAAAATLESLLFGKVHGQKRSKLVVQSIEGPGGIGKTALFDYVFDRIDLSSRNFLTMRVSGNGDAATSTFRAVRHMINGADTATVLKRPARHHFTNFTQVEAAFEQVRHEAIAELTTKSGLSPELLLGALDKAVAVGKPLNAIFPATKNILDVSLVEQKINENRDLIESLIRESAALAKEAGGILSKFGIGGASVSRNAIRENALVPLTEALVKDITAMLSGYESTEFFRPAPSKAAGVDRLLLIIDDYETTSHALEELLIKYLLPNLQRAPFESTVIILGRDRLNATHTSWKQHLALSLEKALVLDPLPREEMNALLRIYGIVTEPEQERAWTDTLGYPFNVLLWMQEVEEGGRSALMLKEFHDRTTRWMTSEQKHWLNHVLFIPEVNKRSLGHLLNNDEEASRASAWFEKEASVRDPHAPVFRVREYLRSRLVDYMKLSDPSMYEALSKAAAKSQLNV